MPRTHSAWDHTYGRGRAARSLARTERFEQAAEAPAASGDPKDDIGAEYLARVAAVKSRASASVQGAGFLIRLLHTNPYTARNGLEFIVAVVILLAIVEFGAMSLLWAFVLLIVAVGAAVAVGVLRRDRFRRTLNALDTCLCPDCGYDLAGAPPGLPPERSNGVNVGPRACPECGVPWPLVPPPCKG